MTTIGRFVGALLTLGLASGAFAQTPDLTPWNGVWLKAKLKQSGFSFRVGSPGVGKDKGAATIYVMVKADAGTPGRVDLDVWVNEGAWEKRTVPLLYLAGTSEDFAGYSNAIPVTPDPLVDAVLHLGLAVRLSGKLAGAAIGKGSLKTLGGYFLEIDDVPGSDERFAGSVSLSGKTTTKLPPDLPR